MKRTRLRFISDKRKASAPERDAVRQQVFARDGWRCQLSSDWCHGPLTPHHRRKANSRGAYVEANLVTLCAGHNDDIEDLPAYYRQTFGTWLVVREGDPEWEALGERANRGAA